MSYFPYRHTRANQDRCEGVLSVVVANIVVVNCTSIHFLLKQRLNYVLLSFEEKFIRINDDSVVVFFRSYPGVRTRSNSADYFRPYLALYSRIKKAEHLGIKSSITHTAKFCLLSHKGLICTSEIY